MKLDFPDIHFVRAASGWLGLGAVDDAGAELDRISKKGRSHPDVLDLRWQINAHAEKWDACVEIAESTVQIAPGHVVGWINRSFALHELKRTQEALEQILPAAQRFPEDWTVAYNIACYHCQLGDLPSAREWLAKSFALRDPREAKAAALEDPDLEPLWKEIPSLGKGK